MASQILKALPALLLALFAVPFTSSCQALGGGAVPAPLLEALEGVTGFSTDIDAWKSKLGGALSDTALGELGGYVDKAKNLAGSLDGMSKTVTDAMRDPLGAITSKLGEMGSLDVENLKSLVPAEQMKKVDGFVNSAGEVGGLTKDFIDQFGG